MNRLLILLLLLVGCAPVAAELPPVPVVEEGREKDEAAEIRANNLVVLKKHIGETVTVVGRVNDVKKTGSGRRFLNFAGGLAATCSGEDAAAFAKKPLEQFARKDVRLTGRVKLHQGKLQIELTRPEQIELADKKAAPPASSEPYLKKIGKDRWLSPAGLQYVGRDPRGKTRVEHIMRHAKDDPGRNGPHGVFDQGGQPAVFALIDDGWRLAEKRKLRPKAEGPRSTYTVSFDRRIGYLGGKTGKQKRNPPLKRLLIVFESGTKKIVTAYPK